MLKLILMLLSIHLFANELGQIDTTILKSGKLYAIIDKDVPKGLSGYVVQNKMFIAKVISLSHKRVKYLPFAKLKNEALASPDLFPKKGDKVVFGIYNNRRLLIAPNQYIYISIKNKYPTIKWLSSDLFANYFTTKPQKEDFQKFCRNFNVGLIDFILDKEYIVDCNSFVVLSTSPIHNSAKYTKPFFATYSKFTKDIFSFVPSDWIKYYKSLLKTIKG
jgi:hypothetical protein